MQAHIDKLREYQFRHQKLLKNYGNNKKKDIKLKREMANIRDLCERFINYGKLKKYLTYGGATPQEKAEYNNFESASDFYEILEDLINTMKSK